MIGYPIHDDAARVLEQLGGHANDFAARLLTPKVASNADLIITMTEAHRDKVLKIAPHLLKRTFLLSEASLLSLRDAERMSDPAALRPQLAAHERPDVPDPIGQSPEVFAEVGSQIAELLPPIVELCRRSAAASE